MINWQSASAAKKKYSVFKSIMPKEERRSGLMHKIGDAVKNNLFTIKRSNAILIALMLFIVFLYYWRIYMTQWIVDRRPDRIDCGSANKIVLNLQYNCTVIFVDTAKPIYVETRYNNKVNRYDNNNIVNIMLVSDINPDPNCIIRVHYNIVYNGEIEINCKAGCTVYREDYETIIPMRLSVIGISTSLYFRRIIFNNLALYIRDSKVNALDMQVINGYWYYENTDMLINLHNPLLINLATISSNYLFTDSSFLKTVDNPTCAFYRYDTGTKSLISDDIIVGKFMNNLWESYRSTYGIASNCESNQDCELTISCTNIVFRNPNLFKYASPSNAGTIFNNSNSAIVTDSTSVVPAPTNSATVDFATADTATLVNSNSVGILRLVLDNSNIVLTSTEVFNTPDKSSNNFATDFYSETGFLEKGLQFLYESTDPKWSSLRGLILSDFKDMMEFFLSRKIMIITSKNCAIHDKVERVYNWIFFTDKAPRRFIRRVFSYKNYPVKRLYTFNACKRLSQYNYTRSNFYLYFFYYGAFIYQQMSELLQGVKMQQVFWMSDINHFLDRVNEVPWHFTLDRVLEDASQTNCTNFFQMSQDNMNYLMLEPFNCGEYSKDFIFFAVGNWILFALLIIIAVIAQYKLVNHMFDVNNKQRRNDAYIAGTRQIVERSNSYYDWCIHAFHVFFGVSYSVFTHTIVKVIFWDTRNSFKLFFDNLIIQNDDPLTNSFQHNKRIEYSRIQKAYYNFCFNYALPIVHLNSSETSKIYRDKKFHVVPEGESELWLENMIIVQVDRLDNIFYDFNELENSLDVFIFFCCKKYKKGFDTKYVDFDTKYAEFCNANNFTAIEYNKESLKKDYMFNFIRKKQLVLTTVTKDIPYILNKQFITKFENESMLKVKKSMLLSRNIQLTIIEYVRIIASYVLIDYFYLGTLLSRDRIDNILKNESIIDLYDVGRLRSTTSFYVFKWASLAAAVAFILRYFSKSKNMFCKSIFSFALNMPIWIYIYIDIFWKLYFVASYICMVIEFYVDRNLAKVYDYMKIISTFGLAIFIFYLNRERVARRKIFETCLNKRRQVLLEGFKNIEGDVSYKRQNRELLSIKSSELQMKHHEVLNILDNLLQNKVNLSGKFKILLKDCCAKLNIHMSPALFDLLLIAIQDDPKKISSKCIKYITNWHVKNMRFRSQYDLLSFTEFTADFNKALIKSCNNFYFKYVAEMYHPLNIITKHIARHKSAEFKRYLFFLMGISNSKMSKNLIYSRTSEMCENTIQSSKSLQLLIALFRHRHSSLKEFTLSESGLHNYIKMLFPSTELLSDAYARVDRFYTTCIKMRIQDRTDIDMINNDDYHNISHYINHGNESQQYIITAEVVKTLHNIFLHLNTSYTHGFRNVVLAAKRLGVGRGLLEFSAFVHMLRLRNPVGLTKRYYPGFEENIYYTKLASVLHLTSSQLRAVLSLLNKTHDESIASFIDLACRTHRCESKVNFVKFLYAMLNRNEHEDDAILQKYLSYNSVMILGYISQDSHGYSDAEVENMLKTVRRDLSQDIPLSIIDIIVKAVENKDINMYKNIKNDLMSIVNVDGASSKSNRKVLEIDLIFHIMMPRRNENHLLKLMKDLYDYQFQSIYYEKLLRSFVTLFKDLSSKIRYESKTAEKIDSTSLNKISYLLKMDQDFFQEVFVTLFNQKSKSLHTLIEKYLSSREIQKTKFASFKYVNNLLKKISKGISNSIKLWDTLPRYFDRDGDTGFSLHILMRFIAPSTRYTNETLQFFIDKILRVLYFQNSTSIKSVNLKMINFLDSVCQSTLLHTSRNITQFFGKYERGNPFIQKVLEYYYSNDTTNVNDIIDDVFKIAKGLKKKFYLCTIVYFKAKRIGVEVSYKFIESQHTYPIKIHFFSFINIIMGKEFNTLAIIKQTMCKKSKASLKRAKVWKKFILQIECLVANKMKSKVDTNYMDTFPNFAMAWKIDKLRAKFIKYDNSMPDGPSDNPLELDVYEDLLKSININSHELMLLAKMTTGSYSLGDIVTLLDTLKIPNKSEKLDLINLLVCFRTAPKHKKKRFDFVRNLPEISSLFSKLFGIRITDVNTMAIVWMYTSIAKNDLHTFRKLIDAYIFKTILYNFSFKSYYDVLCMLKSTSHYSVADTDTLQCVSRFIEDKRSVDVVNVKEAYVTKLLKSSPHLAFLTLYFEAMTKSFSTLTDKLDVSIFNTNIIMPIFITNINNRVQTTSDPINYELINFLVRFSIIKYLTRLTKNPPYTDNLAVTTIIKNELASLRRYFKDHVVDKLLIIDFKMEFMHMPEFGDHINEMDSYTKFYEQLNVLLFEEYFESKQSTSTNSDKKEAIKTVLAECCNSHSLFAKHSETQHCVLNTMLSRDSFNNSLVDTLYGLLAKDLRSITNPTISPLNTKYKGVNELHNEKPNDIPDEENVIEFLIVVVLDALYRINDRKYLQDRKKFEHTRALEKLLIRLNMTKEFISNSNMLTIFSQELYVRIVDMIVLNEFRIENYYSDSECDRHEKFRRVYYKRNGTFIESDFVVFIEYFSRTFALREQEQVDVSNLDAVQLNPVITDTVHDILIDECRHAFVISKQINIFISNLKRVKPNVKAIKKMMGTDRIYDESFYGTYLRNYGVPLDLAKNLLVLISLKQNVNSIYVTNLRSLFKPFVVSDSDNLFDLLTLMLNRYEPDLLKKYLIVDKSDVSYYRLLINSDTDYDSWIDDAYGDCGVSTKSATAIDLMLRACDKKLHLASNDFIHLGRTFIKKSFRGKVADRFLLSMHHLITGKLENEMEAEYIENIHKFCTQKNNAAEANDFNHFLKIVGYLIKRDFTVFETLDDDALMLLHEHMGVANVQALKIIDILHVLDNKDRSLDDLSRLVYNFVSYSDYDVLNVNMDNVMNVMTFLKFYKNTDILGLLELLKQYFPKSVYLTTLSIYVYNLVNSYDMDIEAEPQHAELVSASIDYVYLEVVMQMCENLNLDPAIVKVEDEQKTLASELFNIDLTIVKQIVDLTRMNKTLKDNKNVNNRGYLQYIYPKINVDELPRNLRIAYYFFTDSYNYILESKIWNEDQLARMKRTLTIFRSNINKITKEDLNFVFGSRNQLSDYLEQIRFYINYNENKYNHLAFSSRYDLDHCMMFRRMFPPMTKTQINDLNFLLDTANNFMFGNVNFVRYNHVVNAAAASTSDEMIISKCNVITRHPNTVTFLRFMNSFLIYNSNKKENLRYFLFCLKVYFDDLGFLEADQNIFFKLFDFLERQVNILDFWFSIDNSRRNQECHSSNYDRSSANHYITDNTANNLLYEQKLVYLLESYNRLMSAQKMQTSVFNDLINSFIEIITNKIFFTRAELVLIADIFLANRHGKEKNLAYIRDYQIVNSSLSTNKVFTKSNLLDFVNYVIQREAEKEERVVLNKKYMTANAYFLELYLFYYTFLVTFPVTISVYSKDERTYFHEILAGLLILTLLTLLASLKYFIVAYR